MIDTLETEIWQRRLHMEWTAEMINICAITDGIDGREAIKDWLEQKASPRDIYLLLTATASQRRIAAHNVLGITNGDQAS